MSICVGNDAEYETNFDIPFPSPKPLSFKPEVLINLLRYALCFGLSNKTCTSFGFSFCWRRFHGSGNWVILTVERRGAHFRTVADDGGREDEEKKTVQA